MRVNEFGVIYFQIMTPQKVLCLFAHPDDESFGPGGTIAKWAAEGASIYVCCATRGEIGQNATDEHTGALREKELFCASKILGVKNVTFLDYIDGSIGNKDVPVLRKIIESHINKIKPDTLLTFHLNGVSGHLDHVAMANATTSAFDNTTHPKKLYYYTLLKSYTDTMSDYFIHFPDGFEKSQIDEIVDVSDYLDTKKKAMMEHKSQMGDVVRILESWETRDASREHFIVRERK